MTITINPNVRLFRRLALLALAITITYAVVAYSSLSVTNAQNSERSWKQFNDAQAQRRDMILHPENYRQRADGSWEEIPLVRTR